MLDCVGNVLFVAAVLSRTLRPRARCAVLADHEVLFAKMGGIGENKIFGGIGASSLKKGGTGANIISLSLLFLVIRFFVFAITWGLSLTDAGLVLLGGEWL